jgi:hypothetical protein
MPQPKQSLPVQARDMIYLSRIPQHSVTGGGVVVHNCVRPSRRLGTRGFRAWVQNPSSKIPIEPCDCGWASELGEHYRIARNADAAE